MLNLADIRKRNRGQPEGYWKATTAALCDELERLHKGRRKIAGDLLGGPLTPDELQGDYVVRPDASLDNIRRMLDDGVPVPPWLVRGLVERLERAEHNLGYAMSALQRADAERLALIGRVTQAEARRLADTIRYDPLYDAVLAWDAAIERCDGIVAAEQALRDVVRELRP